QRGSRGPRRGRQSPLLSARRPRPHSHRIDTRPRDGHTGTGTLAMTIQPRLNPLQRDDAHAVSAATALWNAACGEELAISERMMRFNLYPATGGRTAARLAVHQGEPVGFAVATTLPDEPAVAAKELGWIEALAVRPDAQGQGVGTALLAWAEEWLHSQGCQAASLGAGLRHFVPGLPVELKTA